jgi:biotin transport system substrate-specific component
MKQNIKIAKLSSESLIKEIIYILSAILMMAALSRITIPLQPVPVTGQTLGVLLTGIILGRKRAVAAMITYLVMGIIGFPVFANGAFGLATLIGPTGGYLLGFIPAAYVMGYLGDKGWYKGIVTALLSLIIGHAIVFTTGLLWLTNFASWSNILAIGLVPFLPGAAIKTLVAFILIPVMRK